MKALLLLTALLTAALPSDCLAKAPAAVVSATTAIKAASIQRSVTNNMVTYDFLVMPGGAGTRNVASLDTATMTLLIKFRIRIAGWEESPFRYKLGAIEDYEQRIKFYAFEFDKHLTLFQDSLICKRTGYALDANLNAAPFETFVVSFRLSKAYQLTARELRLSIEDPILYQSTLELILNKDELL